MYNWDKYSSRLEIVLALCLIYGDTQKLLTLSLFSYEHLSHW